MKPTLPLILALFIGNVPALGADSPLPHRQTLAPGIEVCGFADQFRSANCGWVATAAGTLLVDLPRGIAAGDYLKIIQRATGKPAATLVLTHATTADAGVVDDLRRLGVKRVVLSPATYKALMPPTDKASASVAPTKGFELLVKPTNLGNEQNKIIVRPLDDCFTQGGAFVYLASAKILFAGPLVFHGPRAPLVETDTAAWSAALRDAATLSATQVVPAFGSWGDGALVDRQLRFLTELRRQVGYFIAQGRPHDDLQRMVSLAPDYLVWMPYDTPLAEDIEHVYTELTVPLAPFGGRPPAPDDATPHALVLIGDQPHEPAHVEAGLRPVFAATGVAPHFAVDVRALSAENLARVKLLVILRDGLQRPQAAGQEDYIWMTPEQEQAVVEFVERGGSFLNLHNSMGLYPDDGPYLKLVGGRYIGHGPLERFRVEVVDRQHPITRGVEDFSVADEQHTPPCDETKVYVLLRNRSDTGQTAAAGWAYEPGQGRLCHLANGHTRESLAHPMYQRLMRNAVLWCLRREAADAGGQ
ncbi:MAG: ThuA domain-containing protein [Pirellulales bacterium]|nr:ThuA domain-containing protein [Pirellulales bacterium]